MRFLDDPNWLYYTTLLLRFLREKSEKGQSQNCLIPYMLWTKVLNSGAKPCQRPCCLSLWLTEERRLGQGLVGCKGQKRPSKVSAQFRFTSPSAGGGFWFKLFKRQDMKRQNQKIVISETRTWENWESHFYKNEIRVSFQWNVQPEGRQLSVLEIPSSGCHGPFDSHRSFKYQQSGFLQTHGLGK